jgi:hypothetical protein
MTDKARLGSVSSGTMQARDLIPAFASELERLLGEDTTSTGAILASEINADTCEDWDNCEHADDFVNALFDALGEYAPVFCYFGASEGDGADYGFWPLA